MDTQQTRAAYVNYKKYAVRYDAAGDSFHLLYAGRGAVVEDARLTDVFSCGRRAFGLGDYKRKSWRRYQEMDAACLSVMYEDGPDDQPALALHFRLDLKGIHLRTDCRGDLDMHFSGTLRFGADMERDTFAVCLDREGPDMRCALGPAASAADKALFDRRSDTALEFFGGPPVRLGFDWERKAYRFALNTRGDDVTRGFSVRVREQVYERRFGVSYSPINKNSTFPTPPAGWMTWYAVQFDACEEAVLENARFQAERLREFGANAVWVDWEWYHRNFSGRGEPDVDTFHPDPRRYPNGLKPVAQAIESLGLVPALWVGFTNDPTENAYIRENPGVVLAVKPTWCGQYFMDVSNPKYLAEFLPAAFAQLKEWGYRALKWDCMPATLDYLDEYHDGMAEPGLTSEEALHAAVAAARRAMGPDFYMLYCSGATARDITMAADIFDAARIGGDIFRWEEFVSQCVRRVMKFYAYHNVMFYNDPDNVVLRAEFNTYDQAVSRVSFVALHGLPLTFGDRLTELPEDRLELLRRALPPVDAHPMDVRDTVSESRVVTINLAVERPWERWNVVDVLNLSDEEADVALDLQSDLHLPSDAYIVYDFWNKEYLGEYSSAVPLELRPFASRVLAVRAKADRPQLVSTSRHITQGAVDIEDMKWDADKQVLSAVSNVVAGDPYTVTLYAPGALRPFTEGSGTSIAAFEQPWPNVWRFTAVPEHTGEYAWSVAFMGR